jgi:hypothetical protein
MLIFWLRFGKLLIFGLRFLHPPKIAFRFRFGGFG